MIFKKIKCALTLTFINSVNGHCTLLINSHLFGKFWGKLCKMKIWSEHGFLRDLLWPSPSMILYTVTSTFCVMYEPDLRQRRENTWPSVWYWPFLCEFSVTTAVVEPKHSPEPRTDSPSTSLCTHPPTYLATKVLVRIIMESFR